MTRGGSMEAGKLTDVSRTAVGVAVLRAQETARADRLFDDPYAAVFADLGRDVLPVSDAAPSDEERAVVALMTLQVAVRTRFYDDYLLAATAAGCRQVVLLGAGLDTRAFRLDWPPGVRLFEVDLPDLVNFKEGVLEARGAVPRCARTVVRADLRVDWAARLTAAGLRPGWRVRTENAGPLGESYGRAAPDLAGFGFLTAVRASPAGVTS